MVKYQRHFKCDKSISKGIKWLNKEGFFTRGCCSGLSNEHDNERTRFYIEFENLKHTEKYQIVLIGRQTGFKVITKKVLRIETESEYRLNMFELFINALKNNIGKLTLRTMGISNWCKDTVNKKLYSIQFYDYDLNDSNKVPISKIMEIFPLDCIMYETKHGIQFISFALRMGLRYTKSRAVQTSKELGKQDYWTEAKDLTLRVSPKWKIKLLKKRQIISKKPKFLGIVKSPDKNIISGKHLEFYFKYMDLPEKIYNLYQDCDIRNYKIKVYHYKTRD